jgi:hypothetical protein
MKEPNEYGFNSQTKKPRVTCNVCHQKRTDREEALKLRKLALRRENQAQLALQYEAQSITPEESDEELYGRVIINLPLTSEMNTEEQAGLARYTNGQPEDEPAPENTPEPPEPEDLSMFLTMDF